MAMSTILQPVVGTWVIYTSCPTKYIMGHMYTLNQIPSEAQVRKYVRRILFGKNVFCPECRSRRINIQNGRYRCKDCRIRFTLTSHSWLANLKLPLKTWWMVLWCWSTCVPVKQTTALTELTTVSVRKWFDTFRE